MCFFTIACPDNRILRDVIGMSWHLMSSFDIFFGRKRRQNSMEMSWHFDGIQQDFYEEKASPVNAMRMSWNSNVIQWDWTFRFILTVFLWKSPWNCHGIWRHFRPKLRWESMIAFYYEGWFSYTFNITDVDLMFSLSSFVKK